jgi:hypothetical protein
MTRFGPLRDGPLLNPHVAIAPAMLLPLRRSMSFPQLAAHAGGFRVLVIDGNSFLLQKQL